MEPRKYNVEFRKKLSSKLEKIKDKNYLIKFYNIILENSDNNFVLFNKYLQPIFEKEENTRQPKVYQIVQQRCRFLTTMLTRMNQWLPVKQGMLRHVARTSETG